MASTDYETRFAAEQVQQHLETQYLLTNTITRAEYQKLTNHLEWLQTGLLDFAIKQR